MNNNFKNQAIVFLLLISTIDIAFSQKNPVAQFIRDNQEKCSFYLIKDDELHGGFHELRSFPLASLSKTLIAIEFAYQVSEGKFDGEALIPVYKIDRFAIDDTNYEKWLFEMQSKGLINNDRVPLKHIARGMIKHNTYACADYLFSILGIDNINDARGTGQFFIV